MCEFDLRWKRRYVASWPSLNQQISNRVKVRVAALNIDWTLINVVLPFESWPLMV